jgi:hypothetical protein
LALLFVVFGVSQNGSVGILPKPLGGFSIKIFPPASNIPFHYQSAGLMLEA